VFDILRTVPSLGTAVDEAYAFASFLRDLRNYGVHPAMERDDLERFFSEEECGLLVLRIHHYLVNVGEMVGQAISHRRTG
jgi:hypothetical protein